MNINEVHSKILFIINKEQQAYISHEELDSVLHDSQLVLFNKYHTNPYLPAKAQASSYGESGRIDDALSSFKERYVFTTSNTASGVIQLPSDYMHLISLYTTQYNNQLQRNVFSAVQVLNEEELIERLNSQIIPVSAEDPIAIMNKDNKIQLFPEVATNGGVYYFKKPVPPKFAYTQTGRVVTYDPVNSVQLAWRPDDIMNLICIALSYYGINMSSAEVMQFAQVKTQEGQ